MFRTGITWPAFGRPIPHPWLSPDRREKVRDRNKRFFDVYDSLTDKEIAEAYMGQEDHEVRHRIATIALLEAQDRLVEIDAEVKK